MTSSSRFYRHFKLNISKTKLLPSFSIPDPAASINVPILVNRNPILHASQAKLLYLPHILHPVYKSCLVIPSQFIQNPSTSHCLYCCTLLQVTTISQLSTRLQLLWSILHTAARVSMLKSQNMLLLCVKPSYGFSWKGAAQNPHNSPQGSPWSGL